MSDDGSIRAVTFTAPGRVEIRTERLGPPSPGQVVVRTRLSAISAGTELLLLRGLAPEAMDADPKIDTIIVLFPRKHESDETIFPGSLIGPRFGNGTVRPRAGGPGGSAGIGAERVHV